VYFPTRSFISLVTGIAGEARLETGIVGREGMLGAQVALGIDVTPMQALVQGGGPALRLTTATFRRELAAMPSLQRLLNRYIYVLMGQLATAAACTHFHHVGPRLARWLLMSHDRASAGRFRLTHEFLACMLGVRRVGITGAASELQRRGLIRYHRGDIVVLDRAGLEGAACSCYAADNLLYARYLG
jgi:hypothetical protein